MQITYYIDQTFHVGLYVLMAMTHKSKKPKHVENCCSPKVSLLGVVALWDDCTFIPADWGS